jgi:hypothetical protein
MYSQLTCEADGVLWRILRRSWFQRLWTIQEVALARQCTIVFGGHSIHWSIFVMGLTHHFQLNRRSSAEQVESHLLLQDIFLGYWQPWDSLRWLHEKHRTRPNMEDDVAATILKYSRQKLASDPKDKVYALYGILDALGVNLPEPDYTRPLEQIYQDVTRAVITYDNSLSLLKQACNSTMACSWIPDFRDPHIKNFPIGNFRCSGQQKPYVVSWKSASTLYVSGFEFDGKIVSTHDYLPVAPSLNLIDVLKDHSDKDEMSSTKLQAWVEAHLKIIQTLRIWVKKAVLLPACRKLLDSQDPHCLKQLVPERIHNHDALRWITPPWLFGTDLLVAPGAVHKWQNYLLADVWIDNKFRVGSTSQHLMKRVNETFKSTENIPYIESLGSNKDWIILSAILSHPDLKAIHEDIYTRFADKTMFVTQGGHMGFAENTIRQGDKAVVFSGLDVPMVIRESHEDYRLVSPAFIHNGMNGELLPKNKTEGRMYPLL